MRISDWSSDVCSSDLERIDENLRHARRQAALPPCDRYRTSCPLCHCAFPAPHRAASYATPPFRANGARRWHEPGAACVLSVTPLPRPGRSPARPPRETPMQRHALASALLCILALSACRPVGDEQVSSQPATAAPSARFALSPPPPPIPPHRTPRYLSGRTARGPGTQPAQLA